MTPPDQENAPGEVTKDVGDEEREIIRPDHVSSDVPPYRLAPWLIGCGREHGPTGCWMTIYAWAGMADAGQLQPWLTPPEDLGYLGSPTTRPNMLRPEECGIQSCQSCPPTRDCTRTLVPLSPDLCIESCCTEYCTSNCSGTNPVRLTRWGSRREPASKARTARHGKTRLVKVHQPPIFNQS